MNNKFSIGVVIAIVLQVSAFVWWTAQQAQTIETLKGEVNELTAKSAVADEINLKRDIADIKKMLQEHDTWINENYADIADLIYFATFTENRWADSYALDPSYERKFGTKAPVK
jgi:hypothetical protein